MLFLGLKKIISSSSNNKSISSLSLANKFFNSFSFFLIDSSSSSIISSSPSLSGLPRCLFLNIMRSDSSFFLYFNSFISYFTWTSFSKFKSLTFCIMSLFANISFKYFIIWPLDIFFYNSNLQNMSFNTVLSFKMT